MRETPATSRSTLEAWLRSPPRRWLLVLALVLLATLGTVLQAVELAEARGRDVPLGRIVAHQLLYWGGWALAGVVLVRLAVWLWERRGPAAFAIVLVPLSVAVGAGFRVLHQEAGNRILGRGSASRSPEDFIERRMAGVPEERRAEMEQRFRDRGRRFADRARYLRLEREVLVFWIVLALGMGARAYVAGRERERRAADLELRAERLRAELARAEVDALRAELNPHFLFNALHTVGGLVRAGDESAALETLAGVGDLLRATLDHGESQEVPLADEIGLAERFLAIERARFAERLGTAVSVDADVRAARVPSLVLLPLVENAVRYGVEPRPEGGHVEISARRAGDELVLAVRDDGPGFAGSVLRGERSSARSGIGIENTRARIAMLYGDRAAVELANEGLERPGTAGDRGACVRLRIPLDSLGPVETGEPGKAEEPGDWSSA